MPYCIVTVLYLVWISGGVSGSYQCSCYTFDRRPNTWLHGRDQCRTQGGDLVSMETVEEWEFIKTQIQNRTSHNNEWWIGLKEREGRWEWSSNHFLRYDKWQPHEPSGPNEKCGLIAKSYPSNTYGLFNNVRCRIFRGRICEYKGKACSGHQGRWCSPTSTTTITTPHHVTKRPSVKTATNTPYDNTSTQHTSTTHQQNTTPLPGHKENEPKTSDHHKLGKPSDCKTVGCNRDCLPYPLLVIAIFVSVLGGLTVLATVAFFLIPFLLRKRRSGIV